MVLMNSGVPHLTSRKPAPDPVLCPTQGGEPSYGALLREGAATGDGTVLVPLDAALPALPAALAEFGIKHVAFTTEPSNAAPLSVTLPMPRTS